MVVIVFFLDKKEDFWKFKKMSIVRDESNFILKNYKLGIVKLIWRRIVVDV